MITCDAHCDALWLRAFRPEEPRCVTLENLEKGGVSLQTLALFSGLREEARFPFRTAMKEMEVFRTLRDREGWHQVLNPLEARDGRTGVMLSIEGGEILEGSIERLRDFYEMGVRMVGMTWNRASEFGYPASGQTDKGIKPQAWPLLHEMARLNLPVDTSHLNEAGFWDLIERHEQPCMASHSCARALCDHFRNLTDQQIRAIVRRGGWIGVNFYSCFLSPDGRADVDTVCQHIDHMCQLGAQANVGLGSDFDGIDIWPVGLASPADIPAIADRLRKRGYSETAIAGIFGENFLDYYRRLGWKNEDTAEAVQQ